MYACWGIREHAKGPICLSCGNRKRLPGTERDSERGSQRGALREGSQGWGGYGRSREILYTHQSLLRVYASSGLTTPTSVYPFCNAIPPPASASILPLTTARTPSALSATISPLCFVPSFSVQRRVAYTRGTPGNRKFTPVGYTSGWLYGWLIGTLWEGQLPAKTKSAPSLQACM